MNWEMKLCPPKSGHTPQKILLAERQRWYVNHKDGKRAQWNETAATSLFSGFLLKKAGGTKPR